MVLKCTFSAPCGTKQRLIDGIRTMLPLAEAVVQKRFYASDKEGRTSICISFEFEGSKLMEVSRKIFGRRDSFSEINAFELSVQLWTDANRAQDRMAEIG
jgi:hypothetical protein